MRPLRVLLLEPHDGGSHAAIARGLQKHSRHEIVRDALPARNWKWRLRAAALVFAGRHERSVNRCDLILASSLQNVSDLVALLPQAPPVALYMHESQVSYPPPPNAAMPARRSSRSGGPAPEVTLAAGGPARDWGLLFADLSSALAADRVAFNSRHHRRAFLGGVKVLLRMLPDRVPRGVTGRLSRRSSVLHPGVEMDDIPRPGHTAWNASRADGAGRGPLILWNHRWEFDKRPETFFSALRAVRDRGGRFRLALLGESARVVPKVFEAARETFADRIVHYGRVGPRREYVRWLARADVIVSTADHENFGISWLEAMAAGAWPLLPDREAYPELLPPSLHAHHLYDNPAHLVERLADLCGHPEEIEPGRLRRARLARRFGWSRRAGAFDRFLELAARTGRRSGRRGRRRG